MAASSLTPQDLRDHWARRESVSDALRGSIERADILLVPFESWRGVDAPVYPSGTIDLFRELQRRLPHGFHAEACLSDEEHKEIALHSEVVFLTTMVVQEAALPFMVSFLASWLNERLGTRVARASARVRIVVERKSDGTVVREEIEYDGPAAQIQAKLTERTKAVTVTPREDSNG